MTVRDKSVVEFSVSSLEDIRAILSDVNIRQSGDVSIMLTRCCIKLNAVVSVLQNLVNNYV